MNDLNKSARRHSGVYELRFGTPGCSGSEPVARTTNLSHACILARRFGDGAVVEEVPDGEFKPFGFHYSVDADHTSGLTADAARAELAA